MSQQIVEKGPSPGPILIVDDSADEARLAKRTLEELQVRNPVEMVGSGQELMAWLHKTGRFNGREGGLPILILLDLKMQGMDGFEVLDVLRSEAEFASIPVVALSGVEDIGSIARAYQFGARTFLRKPLAANALQHTVEALHIPVQF